MGEDVEVASVTSSGSAEVDPVVAARDWLRQHGVDPGEGQEPAHAVGPGPGAGDAVAEGGYARSRRAPGSAPRSISRRRSAARRPEGDRDAEDDADADADADGGFGAGAVGGPGAGPAGRDPDVDPEELARGIVLNKLAVQARTRVELERALQGREVPEEAAAVVLDRMSEVGLIDDATFAKDWVSSRQRRRHLSKTALRRELQTKGVDRDVIDDALSDVDGGDEHVAALDLVRRRAGAMGGLAREVAYRRLGGMLARRGFSASTTSRVLAEVLGDWPED